PGADGSATSASPSSCTLTSAAGGHTPAPWSLPSARSNGAFACPRTQPSLSKRGGGGEPNRGWRMRKALSTCCRSQPVIRATSVETERASADAQCRWSRVSGTHPASSGPKGSPGAARQAPRARQSAARTIGTAPRAPDRPPGASTRRRRRVPESGNGGRPTRIRWRGREAAISVATKAHEPGPVRRGRCACSQGQRVPTRQRGKGGPGGRVGPGPPQATGLSPQNRTTEVGRRLKDESTELSPPRQYRLEVALVPAFDPPGLAWSPGARRIVRIRAPTSAPQRTKENARVRRPPRAASKQR